MTLKAGVANPSGTAATRDDDCVRSLRRQQANEGTRPQWRPIPAWSWMLAAVIAVGLTAFVITAWLLAIASHAGYGTALVNAQLDAVRTGLAAGAGAGAAVGLMLAFRRQHHQEITTALTDHDATERRITELYTKAVEQLGSDKAPVRLGGLYALERLAQDNPAQRQTIVNVICAYLRMSFPPEAPVSDPISTATGNAAADRAEATAAPGGADSGWQQERQVRLTAQSILSDHLRGTDTHQRQTESSPTRFWDGMRLNLTGATLIDFDLLNGMVGDAVFSGATFTGEAWFDGATFTGDARFDGATFTSDARFVQATFTSDAQFDGATFTGFARFVEATFTSDARFVQATFNGDAQFDGATFTSDARFDGATFTSDARFDGATFTSDARFDGATFTSDARFGGTTTFNGAAWFGGATFTSAAWFGGATFNRGPDALHFTGAVVRSSGCHHEWPDGWQLGSSGESRITIARADIGLTP